MFCKSLHTGVFARFCTLSDAAKHKENPFDSIFKHKAVGIQRALKALL